MNRPPIADSPAGNVIERCPSTATLTIEGVRAGIVRCDGRTGHGDSHGILVSADWQDNAAPDWPEAHDPDEAFDTEVDIAPATRCPAGPGGAECEQGEGHEGEHRGIGTTRVVFWW